MRVPRLLKTVMAVLVVVAFMRATNLSGPIDVDSILYDFYSFRFDNSGMLEIFDFFSKGKFGTSLASWSSDLSFMDNLKNVLLGFFSAVGNFFSVFIGGIWKTIVAMFSMVGNLFRIALRITGFIS